MAQGVAWAARELGVPATVIAPESAPQTKLDAIERLGGTVVKVPYERWWEIDAHLAVRRSRGLLRPPGAERARDGGQRHDRARACGGSPRRGCGAGALGRRRPLHRDRERTRRAPTRHEGLCGAARDGRGGDAQRSRPASHARPSSSRRSSTGRGEGRAARDVGTGSAAGRRCLHGHRWTRPPLPSGCSPSVHG